MHRHNGPGDHAAASYLQFLARRQLDLRGAVQEFLLHSVMKFLPAVVCKRSDIVENQAVVLGIKSRRSFRISRAPSRTKAVDELPKCRVVRGLLLRPGANESQQCPGDR